MSTQIRARKFLCASRICSDRSAPSPPFRRALVFAFERTSPSRRNPTSSAEHQPRRCPAVLAQWGSEKRCPSSASTQPPSCAVLTLQVVATSFVSPSRRRVAAPPFRARFAKARPVEFDADIGDTRPRGLERTPPVFYPSTTARSRNWGPGRIESPRHGATERKFESIAHENGILRTLSFARLVVLRDPKRSGLVFPLIPGCLEPRPRSNACVHQRCCHVSSSRIGWPTSMPPPPPGLLQTFKGFAVELDRVSAFLTSDASTATVPADRPQRGGRRWTKAAEGARSPRDEICYEWGAMVGIR
ncbi:hypothetical protein ACHAWF_016327 [Thalassiosira exigua]